MQNLSNRINSVQPSATVAINAKATEMRAAGENIINLSVGEPDFDTPEFIKESAINAIKEGFTKYTAVDGTPQLKSAIINKFDRDNKLTFKPEQIIVSCGAKQGLYNVCQAVLNPGDEVLVPSPYWVSYPAFALLADAKPVFIPAVKETSFKITPDQLERAITPKTKMIFLNSPSNPTGMAYTMEEYRALGDVLAKHPHVLITTDEIYEYIIWNKPFVSFLNACPELADRTVIFNGASKAYAMTGWRIGYAAGPADIIKAMKKIQSQSTTNPCSISQIAAATALSAGKDKYQHMVDAFKKRSEFMLAELTKIDGFECAEPDGAFYLFPNVEKAMQQLNCKGDVEFATRLLEEAKVATVPGTAFGMPGHIRLSTATSDENLAEACRRISALI